MYWLRSTSFHAPLTLDVCRVDPLAEKVDARARLSTRLTRERIVAGAGVHDHGPGLGAGAGQRDLVGDAGAAPHVDEVGESGDRRLGSEP